MIGWVSSRSVARRHQGLHLTPSGGAGTVPAYATRLDITAVRARRSSRARKRALDLLLASVALLLLALPLAVIAALIKMTSRGPALYRQRRIGRDGRPFTMLKFRSMHIDAERDSGPVWAQHDDPRATRVGKHLRRLNLDELPQLWNIVRGDMSIVGPRPERPHFVARFASSVPRYALRHSAVPGLTGWAQVHGWRGNTSLEQRIAHDLHYIENWSLLFDVKIICLTVRASVFHDDTHAACRCRDATKRRPRAMTPELVRR